jgi:cytidylate kinase
MSVVTVSRGSYTWGRDVAEKLAERLGYECVSRELIVEAAKEFNIPELKFVEAMEDPPSFLDRFTFGKERYLAYFQAVLLDHFHRGNMVYHGLAAHFLVRDVTHVLKVRIVAAMDDRVRLMMQRKKVSEEQALRFQKRLDEVRRKWGLFLYGIDSQDPTLYDLVLRTKSGKLSANDAVDIICHTLTLDAFQPTPESQQALADLALAAHVKVSLIERYPRVQVAAQQGVVYVTVEGIGLHEEQEIRVAAQQVPGVRKVEISNRPFVTPD